MNCEYFLIVRAVMSFSEFKFGILIGPKKADTKQLSFLKWRPFLIVVDHLSKRGYSSTAQI